MPHTEAKGGAAGVTKCPAPSALVIHKRAYPIAKRTSQSDKTCKTNAQQTICSQSSEPELSAQRLSRRDVLQKSSLAIGLSAVATELWLPEEARAATAFANPADLGNGFQRYYGRATSASSYGGYGGTETEVDAFKYYFDIPSSWKNEIITKQEKGYQGVDARFSIPTKKSTNAFLVTFPGYQTLKEDKSSLLDDLAIADGNLQDTLALAEEFTITERKNDEGQLFVEYDVIGEGNSILVNLTTYGGRLYVFFVKTKDNNFDRELYTQIRDSFQNVKKTPAELAADIESLKRAL